MADVIFVLKCALITVVIVVLLQIRIGQRTIEGHTMTWVHRSQISQHLQDVAEGAVKVGGEAKRGVASLLGNDKPQGQDVESESQAASQGEWFKIKKNARAKVRESKRAHEQQEKNESPMSSSGHEDSFEADPTN